MADRARCAGQGPADHCAVARSDRAARATDARPSTTRRRGAYSPLLRSWRARASRPSGKSSSNCGSSLPISTVRKWTAVAAWEADGRLLVIARGDARTLLARCAMVRTVDGPAVALDDAQRHAIQRETESLEDAGYRVVAMAYRELEAQGAPVETASLDNGMTLLAWVALEDVLRPNAVQAVDQIQHVGVAMCLATADDLAPAMRVARQCGVLSHSVDTLEAGHSAMPAPVFRELVLDTNGELRQDAFDRVWPTLRVLASQRWQ